MKKKQTVDAAASLLYKWAETLYWSDLTSPDRQKALADLSYNTGKFLGEYDKHKQHRAKGGNKK